MNHSLARRLLACGSAGLLLAGLGSALPAGAAQAKVCSSGVPGDVNGDGYAEVAVSQRRPPSVNVFYGHPGGLQVNAKGSAHDDQVFSQATAGIPGSSTPRDDFGRSTTFGDFNGDGCADLAIGNASDDADGSVTVLYGSPRGLTTAGVIRLRGTGTPLDGWSMRLFGAKLGSGDLTGDGIDDLVVGVPDAIDVGSDVGNGVLVAFTGGSSGLSNATSRRIAVAGDDVTGAGSETSVTDFAIGDFDGNGTSELAVNDRSTSVVSFTPTGLGTVQRDVIDDDESDSSQYVAGDTNGDGRDDLAFVGGEGVVLLFGSGTGLGPVNSREWTPADLGLGNRFAGLTVGMGPLDAGSTDDLVVGGPDTKVGSKVGAGAFTVLFGGSGGPTTGHLLQLSEASAGVPGSAQQNDLFGAAVSTAFVQGSGQASLIVGAPRDDDRSVTDAGRFYTFPRGSAGPKASGSRAITLNTGGVKGHSAKSSRFGIGVGDPSA